MKRNWRGLIPIYVVTILVVILPMFIGILNFDSLPDTVPIHYSLSGEANGFCNKKTCVFFFPLLLLVCQTVIIIGYLFSKKEYNRVLEIISYFIIPLVSLISSFTVYKAFIDFQLIIGISIILVLCFVYSFIVPFHVRERSDKE